MHILDSTGASLLEQHYRYIRAQGLLTATLDAQGNETDISYPSMTTFAGKYYFDTPSAVTLPPSGSDPTKRKQLQFHYAFNEGPLTGVTALDENGAQVTSSSYNYGPTDELLSTTTDGRTTSYGYDARFNVTSLSDPASNSTSYSYDPVSGWLTGMTYPGNDGITPTGYDPVGRLFGVEEKTVPASPSRPPPSNTMTRKVCSPSNSSTPCRKRCCNTPTWAG